MSQRLSKTESNSLNIEFEEHKNKIETSTFIGLKDLKSFFDEIFYSIYFKYTDIKFYFDCLDDNEKIKIITTIIILFICISSFIIYLYLF